MKITAYVPCHNNEQTLHEVLAALKGQTRPADEYLFVNDRCTDRSPEIARSCGFQVLDLTEDWGLAAGRNLALRQAGGDILVGLDADAVVDPDFMAALELEFNRQPQVAALCGCLRERFTNAPADLWRSLHMRQHHGDQEQLNPWILYGSTTACRTEVVRGVGGWNSRLRTNFEDAELCGRLRTAGHTLFYSPRCKAWHLRRDTLDSVLRGYWKWQYDGGEMRGQFQSLAAWNATRPHVHWSTYRHYRVEDQPHPALAYITMLLPWSMVMRDLDQLHKLTGDEPGLHEIATLASAIIGRSGVGHGTMLAATQWLRELAASLSQDRPRSGPLHPEVLGTLKNLAEQSLQESGYWERVDGARRVSAIAYTTEPLPAMPLGGRALRRRLLQQLFTQVHQLPADNWDQRLLGPEKRVFNVDRAVWALESMLEAAPHLEWLHEVLEDQQSKDLLLSVLCMRALGSLHVKMPLNTPRYWEHYRSVDAQYCVQQNSLAAVPGAPQLNTYRICLGPAALNVHTDPSEFLATYLLEQYAFHRRGDVMAALPGATVVDAGAGWGDTSLYFAARVGPTGHVLAFEGEEVQRRVLAANLGAHAELAQRIQVVERPLFDVSDRRAALVRNGTSVAVQAAAPGDAGVLTLALDDFARSSNLQRLDFLKVNVAGSERQVLVGAQGVIRRFRPSLAIAVHHRLEDLWDVPYFVKQILPGYRLYLDHFTLLEQKTILFATCQDAP